MKISKTIFKEYTRCPRVCSLDDVYKKRMQTTASIYDNDDNIIELLASMFDVDTGNDMLNDNHQFEALLSYYYDFELYAMEIAKKRFGDNIIYNLDTKKQKNFSYTDNNHQLYCYLDGYQETEKEIKVFEVKATTSKKFLELGPKIKGKQKSIFQIADNIMSIDTNPSYDYNKFQSNYEKLFDRYSEVGRYVFDLAVERYIIEKSQPQNKKPIKYFLVVLNSYYQFDGSYDEDNRMVYKRDRYGNELVTFIDLTDVTAQFQPQINRMKQQLYEYLDRKSLEPYLLGKYCERNKQTKCLFMKACWEKALKPHSILEYFGNHHGFKDENGIRHKTIDLINRGYCKLDSIPSSWLDRPNNIIQRECYEQNIEYINVDKIKKGLSVIKYPIYYLDFESFPSPLPRFKKEKPYNHSVFQFSLHIEKSIGICDFDKDHYHYLAEDFQDHRKDLVEKLIEFIDLANGGTVIVYNKSYEQSRIKEFIQFFPEYKQELQKINDHLFDLMDLVSTRTDFYRNELGFSLEESKINNYYHNELQGSYSIKKVLPLFSDLSYNNMIVSDGAHAIAAYASFKDNCKEDLDIIKKDLYDYCKQDTWAMVVILWGLINKVK